MRSRSAGAIGGPEGDGRRAGAMACLAGQMG